MDQAELQILKDISEKLNTLVLLSAASIAASTEFANEDKVRLLSKAGFKSHEIGTFLGMRAESVRRIRSKKGGGGL